jgi:hypothetical protein
MSFANAVWASHVREWEFSMFKPSPFKSARRGPPHVAFDIALTAAAGSFIFAVFTGFLNAYAP